MNEYQKTIKEIFELMDKIQHDLKVIEENIIANSKAERKQALDEAYTDGYRDGVASVTNPIGPDYYNNVYSKFIVDCNNNVNSTQAFNPYK